MKNIYQQLAKQIVLVGAKQATYYTSEISTIKATLRCKTKRATEFIVTVGRPNYAERQFIKLAKKAGEPFPIKKIQLKF